ncbi:MAG: outer membrane beta-barrel protein [Longimicrobiaceae bacterium]
MKKPTLAAAALAAAALLAGPAAAQIPHLTPFAFEGRAGIAVPTGDLGDVAKNGVSFGGSITYHALPIIGIYAGGSLAQMSGEGGGDFKDAGLELGARIGIPTPLIPIDPWIRAGAVFHQLELSGAGAGDFDDWGVGYEVGAGLGFGFGPLSLTPGVTWVSYKVDGGTSATELTATSVRAEIGVRIRL